MRTIAVHSFLSLDGVMQAPGGPGEDDEGGFPYGGWTVPFWDDALGEKMGQNMAEPFDLLLGRKTYEIFAGYWPNTTEEPAGLFNDARKYVASTTLTSLDWQNSTLLDGDVADAIAKLKEQPGPSLHVHGSGNLVQTLVKHDLVDEFRLMIYPVLLGTGKRLFADGTIPLGLSLTESATSKTGVVMATYRRDGEVQTGSFAPEA